MTKKAALKRISELSCAYRLIRMTDCPHCAKEVESLVKMLMEVEWGMEKELSHDPHSTTA
jgi:hypothetical protein